MNAITEIIDEADHLPPTIALTENSLAVGLTRAEVDQQIATARRYPRSIQRVTANILTLATLDEETASECLYALPRGGKPIKGPSIRFAEIIKQCWGNCRSASRVVQVADTYVEAEGIFHDLETNAATAARIRRRITDSNNRRYSEDMIIVTGNAACSIALRNGILGGIPKPVWRKAYEAIHGVVAGDVATLAETREKSLRAFAQFGVTPAQVFIALGVAGDADVTLEHIPVLRGMYSALRNGEATVEEMFPAPKPTNGNGNGRQTLSSALDNLAAGGKPAATGSDAAPAAASDGPQNPSPAGNAAPASNKGAEATEAGADDKPKRPARIDLEVALKKTKDAREVLQFLQEQAEAIGKLKKDDRALFDAAVLKHQDDLKKSAKD